MSNSSCFPKLLRIFMPPRCLRGMVRQLRYRAGQLSMDEDGFVELPALLQLLRRQDDVSKEDVFRVARESCSRSRRAWR